MLDAIDNLVQVFSAIVVITFMLVVAVVTVILCMILAIPIAIYQAVTDPFSQR